MGKLNLDELSSLFKALGKNGGWADHRIRGWRPSPEELWSILEIEGLSSFRKRKLTIDIHNSNGGETGRRDNSRALEPYPIHPCV
jgi:hypothetical protein